MSTWRGEVRHRAGVSSWQGSMSVLTTAWVARHISPGASGRYAAPIDITQDLLLAPRHTLFDQMRDLESVWMAAFTAKDPNDREAFDAHMSKVRAAPDGTLRAVIRGGRLVGSIASFVREGATELTYWIDRSVWDKASPAKPLLSSST
jgi:RimJ/RimL family protein N-acetyltransferase